ncbi:hypothetical protein EDD11_009038, partial [Mortierella claussenii]
MERVRRRRHPLRELRAHAFQAASPSIIKLARSKAFSYSPSPLKRVHRCGDRTSNTKNQLPQQQDQGHKWPERYAPPSVMIIPHSHIPIQQQQNHQQPKGQQQQQQSASSTLQLPTPEHSPQKPSRKTIISSLESDPQSMRKVHVCQTLESRLLSKVLPKRHQFQLRQLQWAQDVLGLDSNKQRHQVHGQAQEWRSPSSYVRCHRLRLDDASTEMDGRPPHYRFHHPTRMSMSDDTLESPFLSKGHGCLMKDIPKMFGQAGDTFMKKFDKFDRLFEELQGDKLMIRPGSWCSKSKDSSDSTGAQNQSNNASEGSGSPAKSIGGGGATSGSRDIRGNGSGSGTSGGGGSPFGGSGGGGDGSCGGGPPSGLRSRDRSQNPGNKADGDDRDGGDGDNGVDSDVGLNDGQSQHDSSTQQKFDTVESTLGNSPLRLTLAAPPAATLPPASLHTTSATPLSSGWPIPSTSIATITISASSYSPFSTPDDDSCSRWYRGGRRRGRGQGRGLGRGLGQSRGQDQPGSSVGEAAPASPRRSLRLRRLSQTIPFEAQQCVPGSLVFEGVAAENSAPVSPPLAPTSSPAASESPAAEALAGNPSQGGSTEGSSGYLAHGSAQKGLVRSSDKSLVSGTQDQGSKADSSMVRVAGDSPGSRSVATSGSSAPAQARNRGIDYGSGGGLRLEPETRNNPIVGSFSSATASQSHGATRLTQIRPVARLAPAPLLASAPSEAVPAPTKAQTHGQEHTPGCVGGRSYGFSHGPSLARGLSRSETHGRGSSPNISSIKPFLSQDNSVSTAGHDDGAISGAGNGSHSQGQGSSSRAFATSRAVTTSGSTALHAAPSSSTVLASTTAAAPVSRNIAIRGVECIRRRGSSIDRRVIALSSNALNQHQSGDSSRPGAGANLVTQTKATSTGLTSSNVQLAELPCPNRSLQTQVLSTSGRPRGPSGPTSLTSPMSPRAPTVRLDHHDSPAQNPTAPAIPIHQATKHITPTVFVAPATGSGSRSISEGGIDPVRLAALIPAHAISPGLMPISPSATTDTNVVRLAARVRPPAISRPSTRNTGSRVSAAAPTSVCTLSSSSAADSGSCSRIFAPSQSTSIGNRSSGAEGPILTHATTVTSILTRFIKGRSLASTSVSRNPPRRPSALTSKVGSGYVGGGQWGVVGDSCNTSDSGPYGGNQGRNEEEEEKRYEDAEDDEVSQDRSENGKHKQEDEAQQEYESQSSGNITGQGPALFRRLVPYLGKLMQDPDLDPPSPSLKEVGTGDVMTIDENLYVSLPSIPKYGGSGGGGVSSAILASSFNRFWPERPQFIPSSIKRVRDTCDDDSSDGNDGQSTQSESESSSSTGSNKRLRTAPTTVEQHRPLTEEDDGSHSAASSEQCLVGEDQPAGSDEQSGTEENQSETDDYQCDSQDDQSSASEGQQPSTAERGAKRQVCEVVECARDDESGDGSEGGGSDDEQDNDSEEDSGNEGEESDRDGSGSDDDQENDDDGDGSDREEDGDEYSENSGKNEGSDDDESEGDGDGGGSEVDDQEEKVDGDDQKEDEDAIEGQLSSSALGVKRPREDDPYMDDDEYEHGNDEAKDDSLDPAGAGDSETEEISGEEPQDADQLTQPYNIAAEGSSTPNQFPRPVGFEDRVALDLTVDYDDISTLGYLEEEEPRGLEPWERQLLESGRQSYYEDLQVEYGSPEGQQQTEEDRASSDEQRNIQGRGTVMPGQRSPTQGMSAASTSSGPLTLPSLVSISSFPASPSVAPSTTPSAIHPVVRSTTLSVPLAPAPPAVLLLARFSAQISPSSTPSSVRPSALPSAPSITTTHSLPTSTPAPISTSTTSPTRTSTTSFTAPFTTSPAAASATPSTALSATNSASTRTSTTTSIPDSSSVSIPASTTGSPLISQSSSVITSPSNSSSPAIVVSHSAVPSVTPSSSVSIKASSYLSSAIRATVTSTALVKAPPRSPNCLQSGASSAAVSGSSSAGPSLAATAIAPQAPSAAVFVASSSTTLQTQAPSPSTAQSPTHSLLPSLQQPAPVSVQQQPVALRRSSRIAAKRAAQQAAAAAEQQRLELEERLRERATRPGRGGIYGRGPQQEKKPARKKRQL